MENKLTELKEKDRIILIKIFKRMKKETEHRLKRINEDLNFLKNPNKNPLLFEHYVANYIDKRNRKLK